MDWTYKYGSGVVYGIGPDRLSSCSCAQCKYGHTRGAIGFTAGHIYRACLDYRYGSRVVYGIVPDRLSSCSCAQCRYGHTRGAIVFTDGHIYRLGHGFVI